MKKIILILILINFSNAKESWLQQKNRLDEYEKKEKERQEKWDNYVNDSRIKREIENTEYNDKLEREKLEREQARELKEFEKQNKILEEERLTPPFIFDGKITSGNKQYIIIKTSDESFSVNLKENEFNNYSYYIKNKSKINGGCNYQKQNGLYYDCWYTFY